MTISSETNRSGPYTCNGVTTTFPFGFKIFDETHIRVVLTNSVGVETDLTLGTDYTVSGVGEASGGAVVANVAYATGNKITLLLNVPYTQNTDLENQGAYFAETIERAIDLLTQQCLQLKEVVSRSFVLPSTYTSGVTLDPVVLGEVSGNAAAIKGYRDDAEMSAQSAAISAAAAEAAAAINDLSNYSTTAQITAMLEGYAPTTLAVATGTGLKVNGGSSATLAGNISLSLDLPAKALSQSTWTAGASTTEAPISPAKLATVVAAQRVGSSGVVTVSSPQAAIDLTNIPDSVKRMRLTVTGLTISSAVGFRVQLGPAAGVVTTGYQSVYGSQSAASSSAGSATDGFTMIANTFSGPVSGVIELSRIASSNTWIASTQVTTSGLTLMNACGVVTLAGLVKTLRIAPASGNITAGSVELEWEY